MIEFKEKADVTLNLNEYESNTGEIGEAIVKVTGDGMCCQLDLMLTPHVLLQYDEMTHANALGVTDLVVVSIDMQTLDNIANDEDDTTDPLATVLVSCAGKQYVSVADLIRHAYAKGYAEAMNRVANTIEKLQCNQY